MKVLKYTFVTLLMLASPAQAGVCPMFDVGNFRLESCDDNGHLSQAALDCTQAYYDHVQAAQADVLRKFQEQVKAQKDMQSDSYDRTQEGYKNARKQLEALIALGKAARASVDDLYLNFYFPDDYDEPELTGMSTRDFLSSQSCYAEPELIMLKCQKMIDKIMADLSTTAEVAFGKQNKSGSRSIQVQVIDENRSVSHTKGKGAAVPSGKSRNPASDITGTEKPRTDVLPPDAKKK